MLIIGETMKKTAIFITIIFILLGNLYTFANTNSKIPIKGLSGYYIVQLENTDSLDNMIVIDEDGNQVTARAYKYISPEVGMGNTIEVMSKYSDYKDVSNTDYEYDFRGLINTDFKEIIPCKYYTLTVHNINDFIFISVPVQGGSIFYNLDGKEISEEDIYNYADLNDIDSDKWAEYIIKRAILYDMIPSDLQREYKKDISRSEFCSLAVKPYTQYIEQLKNNSGDDYADEFKFVLPVLLPNDNPFDDCSSDDVVLAYKLGIVKGMGERKFLPDSPITRQEAAVIMVNLKNCLEKIYQFKLIKKTDLFDDEKYFAPWAKDSIYTICGVKEPSNNKSHIMNGTGNNIFSPLSNITREQAIAIVYRFIYE